MTDAAAASALSKRAKRKQPNTKNLWVANAPKIQSSDARAANYLRVAGLHPNHHNEAIDKTKNIVLEPNSPIQKFGRLLGGTDQRVRHKAVLQLRAYLKQRCGNGSGNDGSGTADNAPGLSQLDLLKIWKCLWFTLYMADQVPVQEELANHLSKLIWCVAGTEEEDEYAAQIYWEMCMRQEAMDELEEEEDDEDDDEEDNEDDDVSDEEVVMQEVFNSLEGDDDEDSAEEHENSSASSNEDEDNEALEDMEEVDSEDEEEDDSDVDLADIPHRRGAHLAHLFLKCLLTTVQREWGNMDKYRIDKFYTFLRLVLRQVYEYMGQRHWNLGIIRLFNDVLIDEVLSQTPNGMRLHLMDVCVDELAAANVTAPMPLTEATFLDVLEPYFAMAQTGADGDDSLHQRAVEMVLLKFLDKYSIVAEEREGEDVPVFDQVHVGTVAQFIFELASDGSTKDKYRKALYDVHKQYMRRLKQTGRDVELRADDGDEDDDDVMAEEDKEQGVKADSPNEEIEVSAKLSKKKKRKKDKGDEPISTHDEAQLVEEAESFVMESSPAPVSLEAEKKSKKKQKKKKKRNSVGSDDEDAREPQINQDEEITISVKDQKAAKKAMTDEKEKRKRDDNHERASSDTECDGKRRVKFRELNRARSWTASMRGLRTNEPRAHKITSPEKGILLNKNSPIPIVKGKRKKAMDYF